MAREQIPNQFQLNPVTTTPQPLSVTSLLVTSFIIQGPLSNTDFIILGSVTGQFQQIAPGRDLAVNGDNLDNGTTGYVDLSKWYVASVSGNQVANVTYLERY